MKYLCRLRAQACQSFVHSTSLSSLLTMSEVSWLYGKMSKHIELETGLLITGVAIVCFVLLALVAHYFELSTSTTSDKFFLAPYLQFAYICFLKPHTGQSNEGQQSALESFYSAQVSSVAEKQRQFLPSSGFDLRCHKETAFEGTRRNAWIGHSSASTADTKTG